MPYQANEQTRKLIAAAHEMENAHYVLRLYVAGMTPRSAEAIRRVTDFAEKYLTEQYELEIIDIYQKPALLQGEQIIAVPTLVKVLPEPLRRIIGDMHDEDKLLFGMDVITKSGKGDGA